MASQVSTSPTIGFAETGLAAEWYVLDPRLQAILLAAAGYAQAQGWVPLTLTHLRRSHKEHIAIYAPKYGDDPVTWPAGVPRASPHEPDHRGLVRAADLRCRDYDEGQRTKLVSWLNQHWRRGDGRPTALCHDVGLGIHLHVQVPSVIQ